MRDLRSCLDALEVKFSDSSPDSPSLHPTNIDDCVIGYNAPTVREQSKYTHTHVHMHIHTAGFCSNEITALPHFAAI